MRTAGDVKTICEVPIEAIATAAPLTVTDAVAVDVKSEPLSVTLAPENAREYWGGRMRTIINEVAQKANN